MSASDEFETSPRPRGQSAGEAMRRRRFARQLGLDAEAPARAESARPEPNRGRSPAPPFVGPAPQFRAPAAPPQAQAPAPAAAAPPAPPPPAPSAPEEEPYKTHDPAPPRAAADSARARSLEEEFLAAFSEDPPEAAPGAGEDFLSEFAREPAPVSPPPPRPAPERPSAPDSIVEAASPLSDLRRSLKEPKGSRVSTRGELSVAPRDVDGRKRSREFALNFDRLRKFGFITPSARRSRLSEEIRLIKRRLIRRMTLEETARRPGQMRSRAPRGRQHVILFTSAKPSEGKSFVAVNLALSIILDEGLNVLLVDADAARPSLSKILGLKPNLKGLTDLLEEARHGRSDVSGRMLRTPDHPLTFIPAGEAVESATDLYGGDAMRSLMADLADRYSDRIILIDGPPLLASTEPVELARHAGQVVMVVDAERTTRKAVEAALDLLGPECNVNLVLNKATASGRLEQFGSYYEAYANDSAPRKP
ncbi:P-loop NTPase [Neomegalonema sp.]|uniref:P-loop NTPase n=1 Tax=Neomegalonema sp. TaxID=2039713 RepID=UPI002625EB6C|nr:P-loop NTPase [Neomegalonema sp.]MDD2868125.1 P-loop NTPase [Neomegalonema sp.]